MNKLNDKLLRCLSLQNTFNMNVNKDWRKANYPWARAMWIEAAELSDHLGYKWWKNTNADYDREQCLLELVDIFHFLLSDKMVKVNEKGTVIVDELISIYRYMQVHTRKTTKEATLAKIEDFVHDCLSNISADMTKSYFAVVISLDFSIEDVVDYYLGKNALNLFRYDHGYMDGSYKKIWNGKEDNVILDEILKTGERDFETIYKTLNERYQSFIMENHQ